MKEAGYILAAAFEMILCGWFYDCFMERFSRIQKWYFYGFAILLGAAEVYMLRLTELEIVKFIIYMALHALLGIMFIDALRVVWLYFVIYTGVRFLLEGGMTAIGIVMFDGKLPDVPRNIFVLVLQTLLVYYIYCYRKKYTQWEIKLPWKMLILPLVSLGVVLAFLWWQVSGDGIDYEVCYFIIFFAIAVNVLYYMLVEKVELTYAMEMRRKEYEQRNEDYHEHYYQQLEKQQQEIRAIRHDMKNQLIGILGELEEGDIVRAKSEMKRILKGIEETQNIFYTSNPGMNAVLNFKSPEMERKHIHFSCEADIPRELRMEARDIGILVGNILDNAIEGCERCFGTRFIHLKAVYQNHTVVIVCENSTDGMVEGLKTRKEDTISHGIGIQSMKRLVKSYGGEIDFEIYEHSFSVTVTLFQV